MAEVTYTFRYSEFPSGSVSPGKLLDQVQYAFTSSRVDLFADSNTATVDFTFDDNFFVPTSSSLKQLVIDDHDGHPWPRFSLKMIAESRKITTTSPNWVIINPLVVRPGIPGDFHILFDVNTKHTRDDTKTEYAIFYNEELISGSKKELDVSSGLLSFLDTHIESFSISGQAFVTGAKPNCTISVRWKTTDPTAEIFSRAMKVQKID